MDTCIKSSARALSPLFGRVGRTGAPQPQQEARRLLPFLERQISLSVSCQMEPRRRRLDASLVSSRQDPRSGPPPHVPVHAEEFGRSIARKLGENSTAMSKLGQPTSVHTSTLPTSTHEKNRIGICICQYNISKHALSLTPVMREMLKQLPAWSVMGATGTAVRQDARCHSTVSCHRVINGHGLTGALGSCHEIRISVDLRLRT